MKKALIYITALLLSVSCLAGCKDKDNKGSESSESSMLEVMKPLEMPDVDITIPEGYEKSSTQSNDTVFIKNDASVIVNEDVYTENYSTLDEYVAFAIDTYKMFSSTVEILVDDEITVDGLDGRIVEYIYTLDTENGTFSKYCMTVFLTDGEKLYLITCKADSDKYQGYHDEFMGIVNGFALKK